MKETPLFNRHLALGAKIVEFGGWAMPLQYTGVIEEHRCTRTKAGIFDVSHMGEIEVRGPQALELLQWVMTRNLTGQQEDQMKLSVMTREDGGIIDDVTVYRRGQTNYMVVTNSETKDKDFMWIKETQKKMALRDVDVQDISDQMAKFDLQGPHAQAILQRLAADKIDSLKYFFSTETSIMGIPVLLSRSGYTGEDGYEIYLDSSAAGHVWDKLLDVGAEEGLKPVGLGARDTLRLEAGMMLYGHDLDETTTPWEVTYGWLVNLEKSFSGRTALQRQKAEGVTRKLVGFEMVERGIARSGCPVLKDGAEIGRVTSGTYAPTLEKAIGYALVAASHTQTGTEFTIQIRNRGVQAQIVNLPFYRRGAL